MNMAQMLDSDSVSIELTVSSQRPINLLSSQLNKLMDVASVEIQPQTARQQAVC